MGFWPFGRDPANIELVSRIITAATQNGYRVRGKLTIHFLEPQRQADADEAADRCSAAAVAMLREAPDHGRLIGAEAQLSADLTARYPHSAAPARGVELAALHVVGDPTLSDELRRASGTMPAVGGPATQQSSITSRPPPAAGTPRPPATSSASATPSSMPPAPLGETPRPPASLSQPARSYPSSAPAPGHEASAISKSPSTAAPPPMRRRGSSQIRSIQSLLMPPGTSPAAMGQFVAPIVKDSAARLLIGFLRAHDLVTVRKVSLDENSAELLASLVPASDALPGGYEASRAGEIARWQAVLGQGPMFALHHEVRVWSAHLAKESLARAEVMPALADAVVESICAAAFPDEAGLLAEVARLPSPLPADFVGQLAQALTQLAEAEDDPASLSAAMAPLVTTVQDDLQVSATIIKQSSGG
jgi:hypothetical protein